ncbi:MerR family transcriptional regulator [Pilimelia columellifera]|uniref:MerR family transcriptional regulator n=1 Tax=Pilimelia columellifera subsp. columellifera TaxID=706583 RepID=A0ABP6A6A9_9ACTN
MADDGLSAGAVARQLGVAVTTLRTWHQRYGLGPSRHQAGRHRRYTEGDVARLNLMRRLLDQGLGAGEAADWAQRGATPPTGRPGATDSGSAAAPAARPTGPPPLAVRGRSPLARSLADQASALDAAGVRATVCAAIAEHGVVTAWDDVLAPVLREIGRRHAVTGGYVDIEHVVSRSAGEALAAVPRPNMPPTALLACVAEEQHTLPLEALAAALAEDGLNCWLLGARVPHHALQAAVRRLRPAVAVLWAHHRELADPAGLQDLGPKMPVAAAGPGWAGATLSPTIIRPNTLVEALALVKACSVDPHLGQTPA